MKNIFLSFISASLLLTVVSCESYLDVNDTPNNALIEQVTPDLALSAAQTQTYRVISGESRNVEGGIGTTSMNQLGNLWMNSWAGNSNTFNDPFGNVNRAELTTNFYQNIWGFGYNNIANLHNIAEYSGTNYDNHKAIGKILKSFYMQSIVDFYGDCPYSQAFLGNKNLTPAYDDDKNVYRALLSDLDAAIALIAGANASDKVVGFEDAVNGGNMTKWVQFANSIKLRLLIRQSGLTDAASVSYVTAEMNKLALSNNFLLSDVTINPGYNASNNDAANPFYNAYGFAINGSVTQTENLISASRNAALKLNAAPDARRARLFRLVGGAVVGIDQGELSAPAPDVFSKIGPAFIPLPLGTNASVGSSLPGYLMTLAEVKFLLAEAALLYPSIGALYTPQTVFEDGIRSSFVRLQVGTTAALSTTAANTYITSIIPAAGIGWPASTNKIEAIMYQKWVALMHINAHESWFEYLRTGFPITPNSIDNTVGKPKRLLYPNSEVQTNSTNVPAQTNATAFSTGPFWKN